MRKILDETMAKGRQDYVAVRVLQVGSTGKVRLRLTIRRDSHDFQSYAYVEVWAPTDMRWNRIYDIHYSLMATAKYPKGWTDYEKDMSILEARASEIIGYC